MTRLCEMCGFDLPGDYESETKTRLCGECEIVDRYERKVVGPLRSEIASVLRVLEDANVPVCAGDKTDGEPLSLAERVRLLWREGNECARRGANLAHRLAALGYETPDPDALAVGSLLGLRRECSYCEGAGSVMEDEDAVDCDECDGRGYIIVDASTENELAQDTRECEARDGTGRKA